MRCQQCGKRIPQKNFCIYCGANIKLADNHADKNTHRQNTILKGSLLYEGQDNYYSIDKKRRSNDNFHGHVEDVESQQQSGNKKSIIIIAVLSSIIIISLCLGLLLVLFNNHNDIKDNQDIISTDNTHSVLPNAIDYSRYNGVWHSGQYYSDYDIYEQMLEFEMMDSETARIKWEKYRIAGFSTIATVKTNDQVASFSCQEAGATITGLICFADDSITLQIDTSDNAQVKPGDSYTYFEKHNLAPIKDGKYYAKIFSIKEGKIASTLIKEQYSLDDSVIPTLAEGSIVSIDGTNYYCSGYRAPGTYEGFTALKPIYYFKASPTAEYNSFHVSPSGLNGEWVLYAPSDNPMLKDKGSYELGIERNVSVKDSIINMYNGSTPLESSLDEMMNRYQNDFYTHYFILTIKDRHITEIEMVYMA